MSDREVWLERGPTPVAAAPSSSDPGVEEASEPSPPASPDPVSPPEAMATPVQRLSQLLPGQTRYFEFIGGRSKKYWHVTVDGAELTVSFGRIGTAGQLKRKSPPSGTMARHEAEKLIREKLGKGYQEVPPG